jgi:hypothetical protein
MEKIFGRRDDFLLTPFALSAKVENMMNETEAREFFRESVRAAGGVRAWARKHGLSAPFVSDVFNCHRGMTKTVCAALGLRKIEEPAPPTRYDLLPTAQHERED